MIAFFVLVSVVMIAWGLLLLLLAVFKWNWLSEHPVLYFSRLQIWMGVDEYSTPKYDMDIRKKAGIRGLLIAGIGVILAAIFVRNYVDVRRLEDYASVEAGQTFILAGGEMILENRVAGDSFTVTRRNLDTGQYENKVITAGFRDYELLAFTGIFSNTTDEDMVISWDDIEMLGISEDTGRGGRLNGFWMADHNMDMDGNVNLAPGESAFIYFWSTLNEDQQEYPYVYVIHDGENYYKVDMESLQPVSAGGANVLFYK